MSLEEDRRAAEQLLHTSFQLFPGSPGEDDQTCYRVAGTEKRSIRTREHPEGLVLTEPGIHRSSGGIPHSVNLFRSRCLTRLYPRSGGFYNPTGPSLLL